MSPPTPQKSILHHGLVDNDNDDRDGDSDGFLVSLKTGHEWDI